MQVELLVTPDCPAAEAASRVLRNALDDIGLGDPGFTVRLIDSDGAARRHGFAGSPAFVVDGVDLFETEGRPGAMSCRLYETPEGPRNVPALSELRRALGQRAATA